MKKILLVMAVLFVFSCETYESQRSLAKFRFVSTNNIILVYVDKPEYDLLKISDTVNIKAIANVSVRKFQIDKFAAIYPNDTILSDNVWVGRAVLVEKGVSSTTKK